MSTLFKIGEGKLPPKPEVPKARNFSSFLKAYMDFTKDQSANKLIHQWTGLSLIAAALERKVWLRRAHYVIFPNLYVVIVGRSGLSHKSTSTRIGVNLLKRMQTINLVAETITEAALIDSVARSLGTFHFNSRDIKHSSVFCYSSELAIFLKDTYGRVAELLTDLYDSVENSDIPWMKETKGSGQSKIFGPCINFLGCSTPTWLKNCIDPSQMSGGFASRIVFVVDKEKPERFDVSTEPKADREEKEQALISDLLMINSMIGKMTMTKEATELFNMWGNEHQDLLHERDEDDRFSGYFGRKPSLVEKVSICLSASESNSYSIEAQHVEAAIHLLGQVEKPMVDLFLSVGKNDQAAVMAKMMKYAISKKTISQRDFIDRFVYDAQAQIIQQIISDLCSYNVLRLAESRPGNPIYVLHENRPPMFAGVELR